GGPLGDKKAQTLFTREQELLDQMTEAADAARHRPDARVRALVDWIRTSMCPGLPKVGTAPKTAVAWNDTRVLIFPEYDGPKRYLLQQLSAAIQGTDRADDRIAVYAGTTPAKPPQSGGETSGVLSRGEIKRAFQAHPSKHPLRILIATDAAREGLNLQAQCWN